MQANAVNSVNSVHRMHSVHQNLKPFAYPNDHLLRFGRRLFPVNAVNPVNPVNRMHSIHCIQDPITLFPWRPQPVARRGLRSWANGHPTATYPLCLNVYRILLGIKNSISNLFWEKIFFNKNLGYFWYFYVRLAGCPACPRLPTDPTATYPPCLNVYCILSAIKS